MKQNLSLIALNTVLHQIYVAVKRKLRNTKRHQNKLFNLGKQQEINQLIKLVTRKLNITIRRQFTIFPPINI